MPGPDPEPPIRLQRDAIREIVRPFPHGGNQLEAALYEADRRGWREAAIAANRKQEALRR